MAVIHSPRKGSLQYWPRKRIYKFLPSVNWNVVSSSKTLKGFIGYKAGMASVSVKDLTPNSMTKDKKIAIPATIIECPPARILSARFYKNKQVMTEILAENLDKDLKRKIKLPKKSGKKIDDIKDFDDIRVIVYSNVKKTSIKKTPDFVEIGLNGSLDERLAFVKENFSKEIPLSEVIQNGQLIDVRGVTKGKGLQGPVKRFGVKLRQHKSEKGVRKVGSIGPWHPARLTFRTPMAGQMGLFTRTAYNNKIIEIAKADDKPIKNIKNYGDLKSDYILVYGSIPGPAKRQLLLTYPLRQTKQQSKKQYEFIEVLK